MSASTLVKKRAYIRCRIACSTPPMYWSTGIQRVDDLARPTAPRSLSRVAVAQEVPGRVDERVHRVGLAPRRAAALRARRVHEAPRWRRAASCPSARSPRRPGSSTGSWSSGTGTMPHVVAVDDRDRRAPVALARDEPVAQAVVDGALALALAPRASAMIASMRLGDCACPSKRAGVDERARRRVLDERPRPACASPSTRLDHATDRQAELARRTRSRAGRARARP